jgi:hypothetical protein
MPHPPEKTTMISRSLVRSSQRSEFASYFFFVALIATTFLV